MHAGGAHGGAHPGSMHAGDASYAAPAGSRRTYRSAFVEEETKEPSAATCTEALREARHGIPRGHTMTSIDAVHLAPRLRIFSSLLVLLAINCANLLVQAATSANLTHTQERWVRQIARGDIPVETWPAMSTHQVGSVLPGFHQCCTSRPLASHVSIDMPCDPGHSGGRRSGALVAQLS